MTGRSNTDSRWSVVILGGARDFHAVDWYRAVRRVLPGRSVVLVTDSLTSEGFPQLVSDEDDVQGLVLIDRLLPKTLLRFGHVYRNVVKLLMSPLQAIRLRALYHQHGRPVVHAHPMYFMLVAKLAGVPYVGTPQGDELLIRPQRSAVYRLFARWLLRSASAIVVDSEQMRRAAQTIAGIEALVIQNGINLADIAAVPSGPGVRDGVVSVRAMAPLYQLERVIHARNTSAPDTPLTFVYPFNEPAYLESIRLQMSATDRDLGRLPDKKDLYAVLRSARLVISIPASDSSPRSVYEAIFCGALVAVCPNPYVASLPMSMRERIIEIDLEAPDWFATALAFAASKSGEMFSACPEAVRRFDEDSSIREVASRCYGVEPREERP